MLKQDIENRIKQDFKDTKKIKTILNELTTPSEGDHWKTTLFSLLLINKKINTYFANYDTKKGYFLQKK